MFQMLRKLFWNEQLWLGTNRTWEQYEEAGYRHYNDIYYSIYTALVWLTIRFVLERQVFSAVGRWLGISDKKSPKPQPNFVLENYFLRFNGKISQKEITGLAKQSDLTEREVERWLRLRLQQDRPTLVYKFAESAWKLSVYTFLFIFGLTVLWDKPCLWDSSQCFAGYPEHYVTNGIWWYHNIEIGVYLAFLVLQFFDVKRKDFWAMFSHHVVTLALLVIAWASNLTLLASLVMLIHDLADIPMEISKCCVYLKKTFCGQITFTLFTISWVVSRLLVYPYRVLYYTTYAALEVLPDLPGYYIHLIFLLILQLLHLVWTYFIVRVAISIWKNGGLKDSRSDDEDDEK